MILAQPLRWILGKLVRIQDHLLLNFPPTSFDIKSKKVY